MKKMKKVLLTLVCIIALFQGILCQNVFASNSHVEITIWEGKVANLLYEVNRNNIPISPDEKYEIKDLEGKVLYYGYTNNSIIDIEQVPFGKYNIIIYTSEGRDYKFLIDVNSEYVKTQHKIKILNLEDIKIINTGDQTTLIIYVLTINLVLGVIFLILLHKKRRKYCE